VRVRLFQANDLSEVFALAVETLKESYNPSFLIDLHSYWPDGFLVVEDTMGIQAFIAGVLMSRHHARILMLGVKMERRRQNYATLLCLEFLNRCALRGVKMITLEVRTNNEAAISLYRNLGFSKIMKLENYYSDGESAYTMQLWLQ
jgi:ribosomal-protein-alanine N-acetyltransferase